MRCRCDKYPHSVNWHNDQTGNGQCHLKRLEGLDSHSPRWLPQRARLSALKDMLLSILSVLSLSVAQEKNTSTFKELLPCKVFLSCNTVLCKNHTGCGSLSSRGLFCCLLLMCPYGQDDWPHCTCDFSRIAITQPCTKPVPHPQNHRKPPGSYGTVCFFLSKFQILLKQCWMEHNNFDQ